MENLKIIYIDDYPETSLSKYLDKYKNSSCNVESLDIKFNPDAGYESLINNPDVKSANIIFIDSKLFEQSNKKFRIAQVNTADLDSIFKNQAYFEQAINEDIKKENLDFYVFAATDIINSNSKIISLGNDAPVVEKAFGVPVDNNTAMLENVVSRKKQMLPPILDALK